MARSSRAHGGEEIHLVVENVRHQNQKGSLYVTSQKLAFQTAGKPNSKQQDDSFDKTYHYSNIKMQKISAEGKTKVQLQILLQNDESFNFHFINPKGQADQLKDRNAVKEWLVVLLPKFRRKINKELEDKNKLLRDDPRLFQLYKDLVVSELISADEFWTQHADKLKRQSGADAQETGISAAFLADLVPKADGTNSVRYNLTAEMIQNIFKTYPAVKKKHAETVPDQLTETEFWTKFFQSHYFHRDKAVDKSADNIFASSAQDEIEMLEAARRGFEDPSVNLNELSDGTLQEDEGFGSNTMPTLADAQDSAASRSAKRANVTNAQLIQRFNQHSTRILTTTESKTASSSSSGVMDSQPATPSSSIATEVRDDTYVPARVPFPAVAENELDLLQKDAGPNRLPLKLRKTDRYHQAPSKRRSVTLDKRFNEKRHHFLKNQIEELSSRRFAKINSQDAFKALLDVTGNKNRRQVGTESHLPESLRGEIRSIYASLAEILRHYWSCYPVTDKTLGDKLTRMKKTLEKFQLERLKPLALRAETEGYQAQILAPLYEMIKAADLRYAAQMKRTPSST